MSSQVENKSHDISGSALVPHIVPAVQGLFTCQRYVSIQLTNNFIRFLPLDFSAQRECIPGYLEAVDSLVQIWIS